VGDAAAIVLGQTRLQIFGATSIMRRGIDFSDENIYVGEIGHLIKNTTEEAC
jgi:hypothetical protein